MWHYYWTLEVVANVAMWFSCLWLCDAPHVCGCVEHIYVVVWWNTYGYVVHTYVVMWCTTHVWLCWAHICGCVVKYMWLCGAHIYGYMVHHTCVVVWCIYMWLCCAHVLPAGIALQVCSPPPYLSPCITATRLNAELLCC